MRYPDSEVQCSRPGAPKQYYVNSATYKLNSSREVTKNRVQSFRTAAKTATSFINLKLRYLSLHEVKQRANREDDYFDCDCAAYQHMCICGHVLVVHHVLGHIDVFREIAALQPARKRGRPTNRSRALERDDNMDVLALEPGDWRKQHVFHNTFGVGTVLSYHINQARVTVWTVEFLNGDNSQVFEMEADSLKVAIQEYKDYCTRRVHHAESTDELL
jgi:hypothetical protein